MGGDLLVALLVIFAVVFVWRGPKTLPKLGAALGKSVKDARREMERGDDEPVVPTPVTPTEPADKV
jgi:Sec-independent protein translocase protein TatA